MEDSVLLGCKFSPKSIDLTQSQSKPQQPFFVDTDKLIPKFIWKRTGSGLAKTPLKKDLFGGLILPDFKTYKAIVHKTT